MRKQFATYHNLLSHKDFSMLFWARTFSNVGTQMQRFGLPWIIYEITGSGSLMAINFTISLIPSLIFGILGGVISDKVNRKSVLIVGDIIACVFTLSIFLIHFIERANLISFLFILTAILSIVTSIYNPAFEASLPQVIEEKNLVLANSLFSLSQSFVNLIGPVIAGLIISVLGPWINIFINAVTFAISAILLLFVNKSKLVINDKTTTNNLFLIIKESGSYLIRRKRLLYSFGIILFIFLATGSVGSVLQYYFLNYLHLTGFMFGFTFVIFEFFPVLIMGLLSPYLAEKYSLTSLISVGGVLFGFSLIIMGITTNYFVVVFGGIVQNASFALAIIAFNSLKQKIVPNNMQGRISGFIYTMQAAFLPIGGALSSILLTKLGVPTIFIIFGLLSTVLISSLIIFEKVYRAKLMGNQEDEYF